VKMRHNIAILRGEIIDAVRKVFRLKKPFEYNGMVIIVLVVHLMIC